MQSPVVTLNHLVQNENDVYSVPTDAALFNYTDGEQVEARLREILTSTADLASNSIELQQHITDWPTEYHLTTARANLLRGFDLSGVKRVLELGCGCGAISRYLGEQGIQVDAIEGSSMRAELAALRCRDLADLNFITANFNELSFPEDYYDLVLFVGVTEYAGRFSEQQSDEQAVLDLLANARSTLTANGQVVIAIENRVGLKYLQGACEDHFGRPYIGVDCYPDDEGIRTYTYQEWHSLLDAANLPSREFILPFPDYKIPTTLLHERFVDNNPKAWEQLEAVRSRDYVSGFSMEYKEPLIWQGLNQAGTLKHHANSYLIVAGARQSDLCDFDFFHGVGSDNKLGKNEFNNRQTIKKVNHEDQVFIHELGESSVKTVSYYDEPSLYAHWLRSLVTGIDDAPFQQELTNYYDFLTRNPQLGLAALPNSLSESFNRLYEVALVDEARQQLTIDQLMLIALSEFHQQYPGLIEEKIAKKNVWHRLLRFYLYGFQAARNTSNTVMTESMLRDLWLQTQQALTSLSDHHNKIILHEPDQAFSAIRDYYQQLASQKKVSQLNKQLQQLNASKAVRLSNKARQIISLFRKR